MQNPEPSSGTAPATPSHLDLQQQFIKTRLLIPAPRPGRIARLALINRLNAGLDQALTLLSAPAGFGKTALLADWAAQAARPVAWLTLGETENDPARFGSYLALALQSAIPSSQADGFAPLQAALYTPQPPPLSAVLAVLLNLLTDLSQPIALVLDDYQHLTHPDIQQAVTMLVENRPPGFHTLIATRSDPALPLARWRAHGQLVELRTIDLQFSTDETAEFLKQMMALDLTPAQVASLNRRTEGWIAGLHMAALSLRDHPNPAEFIQAFSGSHRYVLEYLMEEVLNQQPEVLRAFLLRTSILERLCGPLCDVLLAPLSQAATGSVRASQDILEQLEQANLFLFPLDEDRRWYRYHALFADLLRARLQQTRPAELPELHRRASQWFARQDLVDEAIHHAFAAGDFELAAEHVEQHAMLFLTRGEMTTLLDWIQRFPGELIRSRPSLGTRAAWPLVFAGDFTAARGRLQRAHDQLATWPEENSLTRTLRGEAAIMSAIMAEIEGDMPQAVQFAQQADQLLPADNLMARSVVPFVLGDGFYALGDLEQAGQAYLRILEIGRSSGNLWTQAVALGKLANLDRLRGQLQAALDHYRQAVALADRQGGRKFGTLAPVYTGLSEVLREQNELPAAQAWIDEALACMAFWSSPTDQAFAYLAQAQLHLSAGDLPPASAALQQAEEIAGQYPVFPIVYQRLEACRLRLWLAAGELDQAAAWVAQVGPGLMDTADPFTIQQELQAISLARALLALNRPEDAARLLERLAGPLEAGGRIGRLIEALILLALAYRALFSLPFAAAALNKALAFANPGGYVQLFIDAGPPMAKLLAGLADSGSVTGTAAARLLARFGPNVGVPAAPDAQSALVEPLTPREQEVLLLVCQGLSNEEIADQLVISIHTIKKHTGNIYGKLGVTHRAQAVARAHELGLVHD